MQPTPIHARRLLDQQPAPTDTLTITHAQLVDAVQRVMLARVPAIVQGVWNVLQHECQEAQNAAELLRQQAQAAQARAAHQQRLEDAFGSQA